MSINSFHLKVELIYIIIQFQTYNLVQLFILDECYKYLYLCSTTLI